MQFENIATDGLDRTCHDDAPTSGATPAPVAGSTLADREDLAMRLMRGWIWETDREHRFTYFSNSVQMFSGKPPEWHYGKTRQEVGNVDFDHPKWQRYREQLDAHVPFGPIEFVRIEDGRAFWMRTVGEPQFDRDGEFLGYRGVGFDITAEVHERELKLRAEAALVERQAQLELANARLESQVEQIAAARQHIQLLDKTKTDLVVAITRDVEGPLRSTLDSIERLAPSCKSPTNEMLLAATMKWMRRATSRIAELRAVALLSG